MPHAAISPFRKPGSASYWTARGQLQHLIDMGERKNITVVVIPFGAGPFPGFGQSVDYLGGSVPQLDTVQLDSDHGNQLLDAEAQLVNYRSVLDCMASYTLKPTASRDLIHRIAQSI